MRSTSAEGSRNAVCLCCDRAYLPFALFLADQIARAVPDRAYDICICSADHLDLPETWGDARVRLIHLNPGPDYGSFEVGTLSHATYLRLWLGEVLAQDYDLILYLDSDMFLEAGDPGDLFKLDLGGKAIGAVRDMQQWKHPERLVSEFAAMGKGALPYFNAGLMLIDTARYRAERIRDRALDLGRTNPGMLHHHDQSLLNGVLLGAFAEISPVWNWQWVGSRALLAKLASVRIVHFVGRAKPWNDRKGVLPSRYHMHYSRFLSRHFPDCPLWRPAQPRTLWKLVQSLYHSLIGYRTARKLLARFPDPLKTAR